MVDNHGHPALAVAQCAAVHPHGIGAIDHHLEDVARGRVAGEDATIVRAWLRERPLHDVVETASGEVELEDVAHGSGDGVWREDESICAGLNSVGGCRAGRCGGRGSGNGSG